MRHPCAQRGARGFLQHPFVHHLQVVMVLKWRRGVRFWNPVLLCSEDGWLTDECAGLNVPVIIEPFPSSRSVLARLFGTGAFVRRVKSRLDEASIVPAVVHANDHTEGLLAHPLAMELGARSAIFFRSSGMTKRDFFKYGCDKFDALIAVGVQLQSQIRKWSPQNPVSMIYDGIDEAEFLPVSGKKASYPQRVLVLGHGGEAKGWPDLVEALRLLVASGVALPTFCFIEVASQHSLGEVLSGMDIRYEFLARREDFRSLICEFDLVINPSRRESFGMSAIEVLAAAVPLLSSRTGVIEMVLRKPEMLFAPNDPRSLALALGNLLKNWGDLDFGVAQAQANIRRQFLIGHSAATLDDLYRRLLKTN